MKKGKEKETEIIIGVVYVRLCNFIRDLESTEGRAGNVNRIQIGFALGSNI